MKLMKFSASWCGPCKMLSATIAKIEDKPTLIQEMVEIDVDEDPVASAKYGVRGVPTMIIVDSYGNELRRITGAMTADKLLDFVRM